MVTTSPNDSERALRTIGLIILAGFVFILLFAAQAGSLWKYLSTVGVAAMVAGTALLAGALLGFLFGIPRTQPPKNEPAGTARDEERPENHLSPYQPNTNLEQISDWLTKILVGVGLTQISSLPGWLSKYSTFISDGLGGFPSSRLFGVILLCILLLMVNPLAR